MVSRANLFWSDNTEDHSVVTPKKVSILPEKMLVYYLKLVQQSNGCKNQRLISIFYYTQESY